MQRRIEIGDLRLGMYIASLDCGWLDSPFWRTRFLLSQPAELEAIRASGIATVVIDDARGLSLIATTPIGRPAATAEPDPEADQPVLVERRVGGRRRKPDSEGEVSRALEILERSKTAVTRMFGEARLGRAIRADQVAPLVDEIAASMARDRSAMLKVTRLKTRHEYTYFHSVAVCALMINLARQLGLPESEARDIGMAGLLHDIGKMAVPDAVLDKPGALGPAELVAIRSHPEQGHAMLLDSPDIGAMALDVCLHHHERIDGRGYPFGLKADEISLHARMGAICDVYDAITSERSYKRAWAPAEALARMIEWEGHFDPSILRAFVASIGIPPMDALVRLHSNRLALVVGLNENNPALPRVRPFFDVEAMTIVMADDVTTENAVGGDPILGLEHGEHWFGDRWKAIRECVRLGDPLDPGLAAVVPGGTGEAMAKLSFVARGR